MCARILRKPQDGSDSSQGDGARWACIYAGILSGAKRVGVEERTTSTPYTTYHHHHRAASSLARTGRRGGRYLRRTQHTTTIDQGPGHANQREGASMFAEEVVVQMQIGLPAFTWQQAAARSRLWVGFFKVYAYCTTVLQVIDIMSDVVASHLTVDFTEQPPVHTARAMVSSDGVSKFRVAGGHLASWVRYPAPTPGGGLREVVECQKGNEIQEKPQTKLRSDSPPLPPPPFGNARNAQPGFSERGGRRQFAPPTTQQTHILGDELIILGELPFALACTPTAVQNLTVLLLGGSFWAPSVRRTDKMLGICGSGSPALKNFFHVDPLAIRAIRTHRRRGGGRLHGRASPGTQHFFGIGTDVLR
ncbi:hypothetical protein B0T17DRAFT_507385 [Bombardia bombarda]|uniref:Uncharacterized protein n=1 Tax=Bombardia bombarda TaxID=252184 RepID=A0AA39XBN8_9PEZI|nr:hypothetical protein B0T17DRAFT_507385 [Bombardia bombarda]